MPTMRDQIAQLEIDNGALFEERERLLTALDDARTEIDRSTAAVTSVARELDEASVWQDRASAAEDELSALRKALRAYVAELRDVTRGGVVGYRRDSADRLAQILDA